MMFLSAQRVFISSGCSSLESPFTKDVPSARRFQMNHDLEQGDRLMFLFQASNLGWNGSCKVVKVVTTTVPLDFIHDGDHNFAEWGYRGDFKSLRPLTKREEFEVLLRNCVFKIDDRTKCCCSCHPI